MNICLQFPDSNIWIYFFRRSKFQGHSLIELLFYTISNATIIARENADSAPFSGFMDTLSITYTSTAYLIWNIAVLTEPSSPPLCLPESSKNQMCTTLSWAVWVAVSPIYVKVLASLLFPYLPKPAPCLWKSFDGALPTCCLTFWGSFNCSPSSFT